MGFYFSHYSGRGGFEEYLDAHRQLLFTVQGVLVKLDSLLGARVFESDEILSFRKDDFNFAIAIFGYEFLAICFFQGIYKFDEVFIFP